MKTLHFCALSAALGLMLAGCTAPAAPTVSPAPTPAPTATAGPETLEFADQFEHYNAMLEFDGIADVSFSFSEGEKDGQLCYRMTNQPYGVEILAVPPEEKAAPYPAALIYDGQTLDFTMPIFPLGYGAVSGAASLTLDDLTGDGVPELVYLYGCGGTGSWHDDVQIFDLSTMTACPVDQDRTLLEDTVRLRLAEVQDGDLNSRKAVFAITGPDNSEQQCVRGAGNLEFAPELYQGVPAIFGYNEKLFLRDGQLILSSAVESGYFVPSIYFGRLEGAFTYADGAFTLAPPFTLHVDAQTD